MIRIFTLLPCLVMCVASAHAQGRVTTSVQGSSSSPGGQWTINVTVNPLGGASRHVRGPGPTRRPSASITPPSHTPPVQSPIASSLVVAQCSTSSPLSELLSRDPLLPIAQDGPRLTQGPSWTQPSEAEKFTAAAEFVREKVATGAPEAALTNLAKQILGLSSVQAKILNRILSNPTKTAGCSAIPPSINQWGELEREVDRMLEQLKDVERIAAARIEDERKRGDEGCANIRELEDLRAFIAARQRQIDENRNQEMLNLWHADPECVKFGP